MTDYVYDIESLPNVFTCASLNTDTNEFEHFEISPRKNDIIKFRKWINLMSVRGDRMVGYNNHFYDYPVVHFIMTEALSYEGSKSLTAAIKKRSDAIIKSGNLPGLGRFKFTIWEYQQLVTQIDLFKIYHFDNKAKRTSLKRLQFNMRLDNVQESELPFDQPVKKSSDITGLIDYNEYDTKSTNEFRKMTESQIKFREDMGEKLSRNALNFNDAKLGEEYMKTQLKNRVGEHILVDEDGKRRGTKRGVMPVKDLIFDCVQFDHPEFRKVLSFMQTLNMHLVKGKFRWNERPDYLEGLKKVEDQDLKVKEIRKTTRDKTVDKSNVSRRKQLLAREKNVLDSLSEMYADHSITCEIDGFEFDFGKGGLHGARKNSVYRSNDEYVIIDVDVTSFYPSVGIEYGLYPQHLTKAFCPIYAEQKTMRLSYAKGTVENAMLKLALNGAYGKTGSEHSVFYDPKYTVTTTINGQLMLCMLWEKLRQLKFIEIIQANTDGITFYIRRDLVKKAGAICNQWQRITKMKLEQCVYLQMFTRDVNNYVCEYKGGGVKAKGAYVYESLYHQKGMSTENIEWHKNHSSLVVQKAVQARMLKGTPINKFIAEHDDIYDFFLCTNVNKTSKLLLEFEDGKVTFDEEHQRNSRYLITNSGGKLIKLMPPLPKDPEKWRRIGINTDYHASIYNKVSDENAQNYDINYQFYIDEAEKLVKPFAGQL